MSAQPTVNPAAIGARFGALAGLAYIGLIMVFYFTNPKLIFQIWGFSGFAFIILLKIWAVYALLKQKRYIQFKEGLRTAFMVSVVSLLMWTVFINVLVKWIDPSLTEVQRQVDIERVEWMAKRNMPEDQVKTELERIQKEDYSPSFRKSAMFYGATLLVGFLYAAIIAGLFYYLSQRNAPKIDYSPN